MRLVTASLVALAAAALLASNAFAAPKLSPQERRAINRTVDAFVLHAVRHENPGAAYDLVSPKFRAGMSRKEFVRNDPAYPYPARGRHFPWSLDYVDSNEVGGSLLLQPDRRASKNQGPLLFDLIVIRHQGRWVVDSLIPKVIFGPPHKPKVRSVLDYSPTGSGSGSGPTHDPSRINGAYIIIPFAVFGAFLVALVGWGIVRWYRDRRIDLDSVRARDTRARASH
jgi:hypothetical protein